MKNRLFRLMLFDMPHAGDAPAPIENPGFMAEGLSADHIDLLRDSQLHRQLLAEFILPNSPNKVARNPHWKGKFDEPVLSIIRTLKEKGVLVEPTDPRARMHFDRDSSDLRVVCLDHGLKPTGSEDELLDRLLLLDPTGLLIGYPNELLQCVDFVTGTVGSRDTSIRRTAIADPDLGAIFTEGDFHRQRELLAIGLEREPSDQQVYWALLQGRVHATAIAGDLARCRDVYAIMTSYLIRRGRLMNAFQANLIVCIFDLCGARNRSDARPGQRMHYSRYECALATLKAGAVQRAISLRLELLLPMDQVRRIFLHICTKVRPPREPEKLWSVLHEALLGKIDLEDEVTRNHRIHNLLA